MRLIDADALKEKLPPVFIEASCRDCPVVRGFVGLGNLINEAPTVDAAPVVHGEWIEGEDEYTSFLKCSVCGEEFCSWDSDCARTNYCPNCGAKMDGGAE